MIIFKFFSADLHFICFTIPLCPSVLKYRIIIVFVYEVFQRALGMDTFHTPFLIIILLITIPAME